MTTKTRRTKDFSFTKFFNPGKSPHTHGHYDKGYNRWVFDYYAKHAKVHPVRLAWDTLRRGTYIRAKHGNLK